MIRTTRTARAILLAAVSSTFAAAQPAPQGRTPDAQTYLCRGQQLTELEIATRHRMTVAQLRLLGALRSLPPESVCVLPTERLRKEVLAVEEPARQDHPDEAVRYRLLDLKDENGFVPLDGLMRARQHVDQMRAEREASRGPEEPVAGIAPGSWTWLGPGNVGGRLRSILIDPADPNQMWVGSVGGGIWKTTNSGTSWSPVDDFMANLAVTSIVMDPTNSAVLYAGTGEGFFNVDAIQGAGIFKSTDGGAVWSQLANTANANFNFVTRVAISPDGNTLLAATGSGLFRSVNDGANWTQVHVNRTLDVDFDPTNSSKAIAGRDDGRALWSTDGGATWNLATGLTIGGRVEVTHAPSSPSTTYASVENGSGELWKSTNGGQSYASMNNSAGYLGSQGWYDNVVWVSPTDATFVIVGGIDLWKSTDGGTTLGRISNWAQGGGYGPSAHADHHAITAHPDFDGSTNQTVFFGNDGGIYKADDVTTVGNDPPNFTAGWTELNNNLGVTQFYGAAGHAATGKIVGGTQDNGTPVYTTAGGTEAWSDMYGGDGGWCAVDPTDPNYVYGEYVFLRVHRSTTGGTPFSSQDIVSGLTDAGSNANFIAPFILDPNNPNTLLGGGVQLWRTTNAKGAVPTWTSIKPTIGPAISAVAVAPGNSNIVWVGHNNGNVYRTGNGTSTTPTWTQVDTNPTPLPNRKVTRITIDPTNSNIVYVTFGGFSPDNVYRSMDGGSTWGDRTGSGATGLPDIPIRTLVTHPDNSQWLYAGGESGVFASEDAGLTWHVPHDGPANVSVDELFFLGNATRELVAATHGRGVYKQSTAAAGPTATMAFTTIAQSVVESGSATAVVRLTTSDGLPTSADLRVNYTTFNGSAVAGSDYGSISGTLTFPAGTLTNATANLVVPIASDTLDEPDESFSLGLSGPSGPGAVLGSSSHMVTILDDDAPPGLSIGDVSVTEGNTGSVNAAFPVSLSVASGGFVTVGYSTADGTAVATTPSYTFSNSASISIVSPTGSSPNPATPYPSSISVSGITGLVTKVTATLSSFSHTFPADTDVLLVGPAGQKVMLMSDVGGGIGAAAVTLTFDDSGSALTVGPLASGTFRPTNLPPDSGEATDTFPASAPAGPYGSALAAFAGVSPNGTWRLFVVDDFNGDDGTIAGGWSLNIQTSTGDYVASSGTVTFNPGETVKNVAIPVLGDTINEANETFLVNLASPSGATLADGQAQGTILNDDANGLTASPSCLISTGPRLATLTLVGGPGNPGDWIGFYPPTGPYLDWWYLNGTKTKPATGLVNTTFSVTVPATLGTFNFKLIGIAAGGVVFTSNPVTVGTSCAPSLSINDVSVTEGNTGSVNAAFTVTLSPTAAGVVTVQYSTANGSATAGSDYTTSSGTLTFAAGETTKPVNVPVLGDTAVEGNETFTVGLSNAVGAPIVDNSGTGTIVDNEAPPPGITASPSCVLSTSTRMFSLTVTGGPGNPGDWVGYYPSGSTYVDWWYLNGTKTKPATGLVNTTFSVTVPPTLGTFNFKLIGIAAGGVVFTSNLVTVATTCAPSLSINDVSMTEGNTGSVNAAFTVTLSPAAAGVVTVQYATANGSATAGSDYTTTSGTLTFAAGETTKPVNVPVLGDTVVEGNETFTVGLSSAVGAPIVDSSGTGTIVDNDPGLTAAPSCVVSGSGTPVTVTLVGGPGNPGDWIGFYPATGTYLDWWYLNGTKTKPATGVTNTTLTLVANPPAGTYSFKLIGIAAGGVVFTSNPVTFAASCGP